HRAEVERRGIDSDRCRTKGGRRDDICVRRRRLPADVLRRFRRDDREERREKQQRSKRLSQLPTAPAATLVAFVIRVDEIDGDVRHGSRVCSSIVSVPATRYSFFGRAGGVGGSL